MRIPGPNQGRVLQQGFKMCTAKETQHFIHYVCNFLKRNSQEQVDAHVQNVRTTYLYRAWKDLSRAWAGVPECSIDFIFSATATVWIPPKQIGKNMGSNLDTLDGKRIQTHTVLRLLYPWSLFRSFVASIGLQIKPIPDRTCDLQGLGIQFFFVVIVYY